MQTYGFHWVGYEGGEPKEPVIRKVKFAHTEILTKGDCINMESGYADLFATGGDTGLTGVANETLSGTTLVTEIEMIDDLHGRGLWAVYDANARLEGAELDITGATGAQTVGADGDSDLIVAYNSSASEPTIVRFHGRAYGLKYS
jgi:hypothetical protein